jgi:hypothetical protein
MIPIYFDELAEVLKACTRLRPDECTPAQLRQLMADHLARTNPGLAKKVQAFDGAQLTALSAFVLQAQALVGMSDRAGALVGQRAWGRRPRSVGAITDGPQASDTGDLVIQDREVVRTSGAHE